MAVKPAVDQVRDLLGNPSAWLGDGSALVSATSDGLTVLPAGPGQALRTVDLPARAQRVVAIPGTSRLVAQFGPPRLGVIDVATGQVVTAADANVAAVGKLAALDGAVASGAERLRVWRAGQLAATSPIRAIAEAIDFDRGGPLYVGSFDAVLAVDPATGATTVFDPDATSTALDRHRDRLAWDRDDVLCLRSCLMKPEHRSWIPEIWTRLVRATDAVAG